MGVLTEVQSAKPSGWKSVGGVDVAVAGAKKTSANDALFELKWGGGVEESLWNAWKFAKPVDLSSMLARRSRCSPHALSTSISTRR